MATSSLLLPPLVPRQLFTPFSIPPEVVLQDNQPTAAGIECLLCNHQIRHEEPSLSHTAPIALSAPTDPPLQIHAFHTHCFHQRFMALDILSAIRCPHGDCDLIAESSRGMTELDIRSRMYHIQTTCDYILGQALTLSPPPRRHVEVITCAIKYYGVLSTRIEAFNKQDLFACRQLQQLHTKSSIEMNAIVANLMQEEWLNINAPKFRTPKDKIPSCPPPSYMSNVVRLLKRLWRGDFFSVHRERAKRKPADVEADVS